MYCSVSAVRFSSRPPYSIPHEGLSYLETSEGRDDARRNNDPLNLKLAAAPDSALFAALFVRATYDVLAEVRATPQATIKIQYPCASKVIQNQIHEIDPSQFETSDLMYALSVVPSEEEERLDKGRSSPYRTRTWTSDEYRRVLHLLIHAYVSHESQTSASSRNTRESLIDVAPNWIVKSALTPLCLAAYNPDVSVSTVQVISALEPRAMNKTCTLFGVKSLPLMIAASSPLPVEESSRYAEAKDVRWSKVNALTLSEDYYGQQKRIILESVSGSVDALQSIMIDEPSPSLQDEKRACEVAIKFGEFELVREFIEQAGDPNDLKDAREAVASRDAKRQKKQKRRERDRWLQKNAGLLMYPVDALLDLFSIFVPKGNDGPCLVRPMS